MSIRDFLDSSGRGWQVWATFPGVRDPERADSALGRFMAKQPRTEEGQPAGVRERFREGWLTFSAKDERRRLSPVPNDWATQSDAVLRDYLSRSERIEMQALRKPRKMT